VIREPSGAGVEARVALDRVMDSVIMDGVEGGVQGGYVALASFHPILPREAPTHPRCVKLVVDCSGSMGGDSIAQAKAALHQILPLLRPNDHFNLVAFGTTSELLFPNPVAATSANINKAAWYVERMDATMGGTEIGAALQAAFDCG